MSETRGRRKVDQQFKIMDWTISCGGNAIVSPHPAVPSQPESYFTSSKYVRDGYTG